MILNVFHRPDKSERRSLFYMQQDFAHENSLPTTVFMTLESMGDPEVVARVKADAGEFGDEVGLSLHGLTHPSIVDLVGYGQEAIWLFSIEHKREILRYILERYVDHFGSPPAALASYHLDSSTMRLVGEIIPSVETAVAGCFEEGVRVFHGCNHSWYLFNEGMPWGPWYPSSGHTLRPAADDADWCGVVAVPHLMRDMVLSYEGRNDFWASHPPNVMRGMGYEGEDCPYDRNLVDMFRMQERYNDGYSYYNTFVSTAWLAEHHAIDDEPEVAQSLYRQQLEYLGGLAEEGSVEATTLSEFGRRFRVERPIGRSEVFFAKELLYGSGKHYFWYVDSNARYLLDATQGGSLGDLRPYVGRVEVSTGPDGSSLWYGSYPYLIHSQHRTGYPNHSEDGARSTCIVSEAGFEVDLATLPTRILEVSRAVSVVEATTVRFAPVRVDLPSGPWTIETHVTFERLGPTRISRALSPGEGAAPIELSERIKLAPGITEYPLDMRGCRLFVSGTNPAELDFRYDGRSASSTCGLPKSPARTAASGGPAEAGGADGGGSAEGGGAGAVVPQTSCRCVLSPADDATWTATAIEGHLFSPYATLVLTRRIESNEETSVCLNLLPLQKA